MDQEVKKVWVERLRSGLPQGRQALNYNDEKFCCLGVLCEIGVERGILTRVENVDDMQDLVGYKENSDHSGTAYTHGLPVTWARQLGLSDLGHRKQGPALSTLNDKGIKFAEIADIIEEEF